MFRRRFRPQTLIAVAYDLTGAALAWTVVFFARWSYPAPPEAQLILLQTLPVVIAIELACFARFGLYRGIWRYASMHDVKRIVSAVGLSALLVPAALLLWRHGLGVPRMMYLLNPLLLVLFMGGGRIVYRWWKEHRQFRDVRSKGRPVLLLGAGDATRRLLLEIERSPSWLVVGLLDDNDRKVGRDIAGFPVLGTWDELSDVAARTECRHAILATPGADAGVRRRAFELCEKAGLNLLVVPDLDHLISGKDKISEIRHVELDDLLGRDPVSLDVGGLAQLIGKRPVLVTGAGGSIGSELCRQIARFEPRALVLFELNEFGLYRTVEDLGRLFPDLELIPVIGDVKDRRRLDEVFERFSPEIVFHAAAYKHVPLLEELNAWEAVRNNALGTRTLADAAAAARHGVRKLVFISTDKAVNPTNAMGATKRLAELMLQFRHVHRGLPVVMVRFGNVLGSSGSVIPKFKEQIARGGPITVTHPEITRYFMSIPEATQLVLQAGLMGGGGEIFVLDMGQPVRIVDLARDMIRLSGLTEAEIGIEYTGLRPGEKLFEELLASDETTLPTRHPKLRISRPLEPPAAAWEARVSSWLDSDRAFGDDEVRGWLRQFVPEYAPVPGLLVTAPAADAPPLAAEPHADGAAGASATAPGLVPAAGAAMAAAPVRLMLVATGIDGRAAVEADVVPDPPARRPESGVREG
jgi:FlaA1/EpsC-like NDP-sugar epimerase